MSDSDIAERNFFEYKSYIDDADELDVSGAAEAAAFRRNFSGPLLDDIVLAPYPEIEKILTSRYGYKIPYTYQGALLLSINPFAPTGAVANSQQNGRQPPLYANSIKAMYHESNDPYHLAPHIYTIMEVAYRNMCQYHEDQIVVVSGESGSGKTFASAKLLEYCSKISVSSDLLYYRLQKAILGSVPLLEAFGNAATRVNDNSSRFGKLIELFFDPVHHYLSGGYIMAYMLEKSRVTNYRAQERNFHVLHQIATNQMQLDELIGRETIAQLKATGAPSGLFSYLPVSPKTPTPINDAEGWKNTRKCMSMVGLSDLEVTELSRALTGILVLGNVRFKSVTGPSAGYNVTDVATVELLDAVASLWQVSGNALRNALCYRTIATRGETTRMIQDVPRAEYNRDSLARSVYEKIFYWLVSRINRTIAQGQTGTEGDSSKARLKPLIISILDFMGFEINYQNSFDYLNINWVNEKIFGVIYYSIKQELEECAREGVDQGVNISGQSTRVGGGLNADECINIIEGRPMGVHSLLDEESMMPRGNDQQYLQKLADNLGKPPKPGTPRIFEMSPLSPPMTFSLAHSAAKVMYNVSGWVEYNKDTVHGDLVDAMGSSTLTLLQLLFPRSNVPVGYYRSKMYHTLVSTIRREFYQLNQRIGSRKHSFIRCILPNRQKLGWTIDAPVLHEYIVHMGLAESAAIRSSMNFKVKMSFVEFADRYKLCCADTWPSWSVKEMSPKQACERILSSNGIVNGKDFALGSTKLFLTSQAVLLAMDDILEKYKDRLASIIQYTFRRYRAKKAFHEYKTLADALAAANIIVDASAVVAAETAIPEPQPAPGEPGQADDTAAQKAAELEQKKHHEEVLKKYYEQAEETGAVASGELRLREHALRLRGIDPNTQEVISSPVLVVLSDLSMCVMEPKTLSVETAVGYDSIDKVCVSALSDGVVLFKLKSSQPSYPIDDIILDIENKDEFIKVLHQISPNTKIEIIDHCIWSKPRTSHPTLRDTKVFFRPTQRFQNKQKGIKVDGNSLIIEASRVSDPYGGKKLRRQDSMNRKYFGDYVRLTGGPLLKSLNKDHGDSVVAFSAVCSVYPTKTMYKQERLVMCTDKALYTLDPKGYLVNRHIGLEYILCVECSPAHDDFLLFKLHQAPDLLVESSKKTELLQAVSDMYRKLLKKNLEVVITDVIRARLADGKGKGFDLVELSFYEDADLDRYQAMRAETQGSTTIVDIFLKPPAATINKEGAKIAIYSVSMAEYTLLLPQVIEQPAPVASVEVIKSEEEEETPVAVAQPVLLDIYGGRKYRRRMSLISWKQGDYLHFRYNPQFRTKVLEGKLNAPKGKIFFSGVVTKISRHHKAQYRRLVITDSHVLSMEPDTLNVKTCLDIKDITSVSVSTMRDGFIVVHLRPDTPGDKHDYLLESHSKTELIELLRSRRSVLLPRQEALPITVDDTITYHPKDMNSVSIIQLRHDPLVYVPTLVPTQNGLLIKVNNEDGPGSNLLTMDEETAKKEMLRKHEENFAGLKDTSAVGMYVYSGKKGRRRESMNRYFVGDYLRLDEDDRMEKLMQKTDDKQVVFSSYSNKYNKQNKKYERIIAVTDKALYNIEDIEKLNCKRRIALDEIEGVSVSNLADSFMVIHCPGSYDYIFETDKKTELIGVLQRANPKLKVRVAEKFDYMPDVGKNSSVSFVLDDNRDSTWLENKNGLLIHVANKQPSVTLESAFLYIKDYKKPIEVFSEPLMLKLKKHHTYKLEIRFYVNEDLPAGCQFLEKIDRAHKRVVTKTPINALRAREERYVVTLPERNVLYSVMSKTRVKCKLEDPNGNILLSVRFIYTC